VRARRGWGEGDERLSRAAMVTNRVRSEVLCHLTAVIQG